MPNMSLSQEFRRGLPWAFMQQLLKDASLFGLNFKSSGSAQAKKIKALSSSRTTTILPIQNLTDLLSKVSLKRTPRSSQAFRGFQGRLKQAFSHQEQMWSIGEGCIGSKAAARLKKSNFFLLNEKLEKGLAANQNTNLVFQLVQMPKLIFSHLMQS